MSARDRSEHDGCILVSDLGAGVEMLRKQRLSFKETVILRLHHFFRNKRLYMVDLFSAWQFHHLPHIEWIGGWWGEESPNLHPPTQTWVSQGIGKCPQQKWQVQWQTFDWEIGGDVITTLLRAFIGGCLSIVVLEFQSVLVGLLMNSLFGGHHGASLPQPSTSHWSCEESSRVLHSTESVISEEKDKGA